MMAPPFRWYDKFVDSGYPRVLTLGELRVVLAVGRHVDRELVTPAKIQTLLAETGLSRSGFFKATRGLKTRGILTRSKRGRRWLFILNDPLPSPQVGPRVETIQSTGVDFSVHGHGLANGEIPTQTRRSAHPRQKSKTQLRGQSGSAAGEVGGVQGRRRYASPQAGQEFLRMLGVETSDIELLTTVAGEIERHDALDEVAHELSRLLQSRGHLIPQVKVRSALEPDVRTAATIFDGAVVEVRDVR